MKKLSQHKVLLSGDSYEHCCNQLHKFFDLTSLVIYDCIECREELSFPGLDTEFSAHVAAAENYNRSTIKDLIAELVKSGIQQTTDLQHIAQGYVSKTLHILSHFLDGFIGIDSYFYNLLDDSHWLPAQTLQAIKDNPGHYWLIHIDCYSATPEEAGLLRL
ncbi:MAG: hypothetical protein KJ630_01405 [Proteobacteria bacterium]|nr:hypothetical protein [Pseudomonadota bacterium]